MNLIRCCLLVLLPTFSSIVFAQDPYTFPVPVEYADRIDQSNSTFPWIYVGNGTNTVPPSSRSIGCSGTYPNGAPARVDCNNPASIIGPQYICEPVQRPTHVGEVTVGYINIPTTVTGMSDGHNPDSCSEPYVGNTQSRTSYNKFNFAGGRWACPSGYFATDVNRDGNLYGDEAFPYQYNPESCAAFSCPVGTILTSQPSDPRASYYGNNPGYVCTGPNEEKQPRKDCESCPNPMEGDPIVVATGNSFQTETDYVSQKIAGLNFVRYFNSRGRAKVRTSLSKGWTHSYESRIIGSHRLLDFSNTISLAHVSLMRPTGETELFLSSGLSYSVSGTDYVDWVADYDNQSTTLTQVLEAGTHTSSWIYSGDNDQVETYDADGRLTKITYRQGQTTLLRYDLPSSEGGDDDNVTLDTVTDFTGDTLSFEYDSLNRIVGMIDPDGQSYTYEYSTANNLTKVIFPDQTPLVPSDNPFKTYHYENTSFSDFLTGISDENGDRFVTWTFDTSGRATSSELAGGIDHYSFAYTPSNVTVTDPLGRQSVYTFEAIHGVKFPSNEQRLATTNLPATTQESSYDAFGNRIELEDTNGNTTNLSFDSRGLQDSRTEAVGSAVQRIVSKTWHPDFRLPLTVTEPGRTTTYTYDAYGNVLTRTETDTTSQTVPYSTNGRSRTWAYTYYPSGVNGAYQVATINGPRTDVSDITTYTYNADGFVSTVTNPLGHVTEVTGYNARGLPLSMLDQNNVVTQMTYHPRGWLLSSTILDPSGNGQHATSQYHYDDVGQMTRVTLPNGSYLDYEYDAAHRLTAISNNLGERQEYVLDVAGNITEERVKDAPGNIKRTQQTVYDELSRIHQMIGGAGQVAQYTYDQNGNQLSTVLDPSGLNQQTLQAFDALNRLSNMTDAYGNQSAYSYDARDNLISVTDQRSFTTSYTYDGLNNLIQLDSPDTGVTIFTYDDAGNQIDQTDARGVNVQYDFDALNRLTAVTYPSSPTENIAYTYDQPSGMFGVGRLTQLNDQTGSTQYVFDHRGNQFSVTVNIQGNLYSTYYTYDLADNLIQTTYPSGRVVSNQLDSLGRTSSVSTATSVGNPSQTIASAIDYLPFGPVQTLQYGNGLELSLDIDADYRLSNLAVSGSGGVAPNILDRGYTQNAVNNITAISDSVDSARSQDFTYDQLNRLISADGAYGLENYTYDPVGNRLSLTVTKGGTNSLETYTYDTASNRLLSIDVDGDLRTLSYDNAGNIIDDDRGAEIGFDLIYNAQNRLIDAIPQQGAQP